MQAQRKPRRWIVVEGDCVALMSEMEENSVDSIVTDPPYGLKFMGKDWDDMGHGSEQQAWHYRWAVEALRVLKPGGYLLAFGGTRTYHRLVSAIEDAGFEIRDQIQWLYGTGFPKSHNISKAIDKQVGAERKVIGRRTDSRYAHGFSDSANRPMGSAVTSDKTDTEVGFQTGKGVITEAATPEAAQWEGWGTALKPAHEPIVVARKPFKGTVATNVLEHGVGGLNIDATRIESSEPIASHHGTGGSAGHTSGTWNNTYKPGDSGANNIQHAGRWPANVILDEEAGAMLDEQSGNTTSNQRKGYEYDRESVSALGNGLGKSANPSNTYADKGGASRFFYCAKASKTEREAGLKPPEDDKRANTHPTVKPISLMEYLIRLVTPPDGLVLDPFVGSGTTGIATLNEGFRFTGFEVEEKYVELSRSRIRFAVKEMRQKGNREVNASCL